MYYFSTIINMANYIFYDGELLERAGGPSTYLYNLREGIKKYNSQEIEFITRVKEQKYKKASFYKLLKQRGIETFPKMYEKIMIKHQMDESEIFKSLSQINNMELIHFHSTSNYVKAKKYIKRDVITLLTSHSPEITSKQVAKSLSDKYDKGKYQFQKMEDFYFHTYDEVAFKEADVLVFPSPESMEPYYETCNEFGEWVKNKNIKYIMTGTKPLQYRKNREDFRKENNIPEEAFVISFIGRHNEVKGYDNFIKIAEKVMKREKNIYIVTAGIGNIQSPKDDKWIDIGWTNDPGSIINASDLFILSNRRTYFDLVLLEVLSIGKTSLVSNTGGNKTIERLSNGVIKYDTIEDASKKILELYNNKDKLKDFERENRKIYNQYFTVDEFTKNYIKMIEEIRKENNFETRK